MKKLLSLGIITTIILVGLAGCFQQQQQVEEPEVEKEMTLATYENDTIGFTFDYPSTMDLEEMDDQADYLSIVLTDDDNYIRFDVEHIDYYNNTVDDVGTVFYEILNPCEEDMTEDNVSHAKIGECEKVSSEVTSYLDATSLGDIGFGKFYYIDTPNPDWPEAELWVNLISNEEIERYGDELENRLTLPLSDAQEKSIEVAEIILNSLEFINL